MYKYKHADQVLRAIKSNEYCGIIIYEGASRIDGKPIVAIFNRITDDSDNDKTGAMVQSWIMRSDMKPNDAVKTGDDVSVCGNCPLRPVNKHMLKPGQKPCYVKTWQAPRSVYAAYVNGRYLKAGVDFPIDLVKNIFSGLKVRFGSYGDPFALPVSRIAMVARYAKRITGYSHQWQNPKAGKLSRYCMASVDNESDAINAHESGWRTFRTRENKDDVLPNEVICPASKEAGVRTNCAECGLCAGNSVQAKSPVIIYH